LKLPDNLQQRMTCHAMPQALEKPSLRYLRGQLGQDEFNCKGWEDVRNPVAHLEDRFPSGEL